MEDIYKVMVKDIRDKLVMAVTLHLRSELEEAFKLFDDTVKMVKSAMKKSKLNVIQSLLQHAISILHEGSEL